VTIPESAIDTSPESANTSESGNLMKRPRRLRLAAVRQAAFLREDPVDIIIS
jgi:hypothetical protein